MSGGIFERFLVIRIDPLQRSRGQREPQGFGRVPLRRELMRAEIQRGILGIEFGIAEFCFGSNPNPIPAAFRHAGVQFVNRMKVILRHAAHALI